MHNIVLHNRIINGNINLHVVCRYNNLADQQPTAITGIRCPVVKFPSTEGNLFLMRCDNSAQLIPTEDCQELVGIQCSKLENNMLLNYSHCLNCCCTGTVDSGDQPYNGQIRRIEETDGDRTELLQINFDKAWLPVCTKYMSNSSADSACRQLGFTSSSQPPISSK